MALADTLAARKGDTKKGPRCSAHVLLEQLSTEDRKALEAAMRDSGFATASLVRALRDEGYEFGYTTIARHRNGECKG